MGGRVAVLVSGEGTNLQALLDDPVVGPPTPSAGGGWGGPAGAGRAGVQTLVLDAPEFDGREGLDRALLEGLRARDVDVVALAGFMRILGPEVVRAFAGRIVNVHPALLPSFPGAHAVSDALAWGEGHRRHRPPRRRADGPRPHRRPGGGADLARRRLGLPRVADPRGRAPVAPRRGPSDGRGPAARRRARRVHIEEPAGGDEGPRRSAGPCWRRTTRPGSWRSPRRSWSWASPSSPRAARRRCSRTPVCRSRPSRRSPGSRRCSAAG